MVYTKGKSVYCVVYTTKQVFIMCFIVRKHSFIMRIISKSELWGLQKDETSVYRKVYTESKNGLKRNCGLQEKKTHLFVQKVKGTQEESARTREDRRIKNGQRREVGHVTSRLTSWRSVGGVTDTRDQLTFEQHPSLSASSTSRG